VKKLLLTTLLIGVTTLTMAKEIDLTESKGIDQEMIVSFNPTPASLTVDKNITFKIIFNVDLDEKHVKKNDIQLQNISDNPKNIEGNVAYIADEKAVTFKAEQPLAEGYYEIAFKSLKATKANKDEQIKEIKYRFYVPEVINGHMLPPVPDSKINDATLEGVDVNNNGVRDDVERWIIKKYAPSDYPKTKTEIALQWARTAQLVIQSPETAYEDEKYLLIMRANICEVYSFSRKLQKSGNYRIDNDIFNDEFVEKAFNTKERMMAYSRFNGNLAGHVYGSLRTDASKCDFDIDEIEE